MTGAPLQGTPTPGLVFKMYRAVVGVGLVCGLAIVTVFEVTRPIIARNKIEARQRAILHVLPGAPLPVHQEQQLARHRDVTNRQYAPHGGVTLIGPAQVEFFE